MENIELIIHFPLLRFFDEKLFQRLFYWLDGDEFAAGATDDLQNSFDIDLFENLNIGAVRFRADERARNGGEVGL